MRKFVIGAALIAGAIGTPAFAQETAPFTGAHVEGLIGYDDVGDSDGLLYGIGAGFDFQAGKAILGIEAEFADSDVKTRASDLLVTGDTAQVVTGRDIYVGGRLGFALAPSTMLYAKAGYTNAKLKGRYTDAAGVLTRDGTTADGYRLGAGIEQKFNLFGPSGFVKAEYRYSNYKNLDVGNLDLDIDVDRHQVLAGIGVRF